MSDNEFYDECLGCGVRHFQGFFAPSVDGTSIDGVGDGIRADDSVASAAISPINGNSASPSFPDGCNGLKYDCETGAIWYDTPACQLRLLTRAGFLDYVNATGVPSASETSFETIAEPIDLGDCYEGMVGVVIGYTEFRTRFTASDANQFLNAYEIRYQFTLSSGGQTVFTENMREGKSMPGYQLSERCLQHTIPFTACYNPALGLNQEIAISASTTYRGSNSNSLANINTSFETTSKAFVMKER